MERDNKWNVTINSLVSLHKLLVGNAGSNLL